MFNPEKILGGLLKDALKGAGTGVLGTKATVGVGLLGLAMGAAEHYMKKPSGASAPPPPPGSSAGGAPPPPPPGAAPPPPPPAASRTAATESDALLMIRAMIASANADGQIDADEQQRIMEKLSALDLSEAERAFVEKELADPPDMETIVSSLRTSDLAGPVYAVSVLAVDLDSDAERRYLRELARRLGLNFRKVADIHAELGISPPEPPES